jgi:DNA-binding NtrC family response regulator
MVASLPDAADDAALTMPEHCLSLVDASGDVRPLEEIESEIIRFAIAHYRGQMSEVARRLKIGRSTLYRKLEHLERAKTGDTGPRSQVAVD